ncbi:MAG: hypothetical protein AAGA66_12035 [Bacteroidota bacterium]
MYGVLTRSQIEEILESIDSLDKLTWYKNLDEEDYQLIKEVLTSCKSLIVKSDPKSLVTEDLKENVEELEMIFFELTEDSDFIQSSGLLSPL